MNVDLINPFLNATMNVISTMAMLEINPGKPACKTDHLNFGDVTGFIEMNMNNRKGSLAVSFQSQAILAIYQNMLGEQAQEINADVCDLVGELTNMITGGAKQQLSEHGYHIDMASPKVITDAQSELPHPDQSPIITMPFEVAASQLVIEFCLPDK